MADYSELVQAFRWVIEQRVQKKFIFTRGLIGDGQGNVDVTDRPNFSYVRPDRGRADYVEMFNKLANTAVDGTPILIGNIPWQPNLTQVLGVDWEAFISVGWNTSFGGLAAHGQSHAWLDGREPEADYFDIHFRQILPLRTYPLGSGTPSVLVTTWGTEYSGTFVTWPGEPGLSLANAVPPSTGIMREMLVFWDVGLNQLSAMTGTLSYSVTTAPPRPVLATTGSFIPSGYVRLQGGQQSIANTDIFDARQFLSSSSLVSAVTSTDTTSFWQQAADTDTLIPVSAEKVRLGLAGQADTNIADHWLEIITTGTPSQATVHYDTVSSIGNISNVYRAKGTQASPAAVADNDVIFKETYYGYAATGVTWFSVAQMRVEIDGIPIGDDIPGSIVFDAHTPGDAGGGLTERLRIAPTGVIVNAQQEEIDFRVAGSLGDDNVFFVSGLNEVAGIGTGNPDAKFEVLATTTQLRLTHTNATKFADFTVNTNHDLTVKPSSTGQIKLNATVTVIDEIQHEGDADTKISFTADKQTYTVGGLIALQMTNTAQDLVEIGDVAGTGDWDINFNNGQMFLQGSDGFFGMNTITPTAQFDLANSGVVVARFGDGLAGVQVEMDGAAASVRDWIYSTAGVKRWQLRADATAEGGSNAGSNFALVARTDAGGLLGHALLVERSTQNVRIGANTLPNTRLDIGDGAIEFAEMTAPGGGAVNTARIYAVDNGGKTELLVIFNTGAAIQLAIQP